jgi:glycosyltransferase involved in cell wall biosynthesis
VSRAMPTAGTRPQMLGADAFVLVWGPPSHGPRSRVLARALGIDVRFVARTRRRGIVVAPFKYVVAAIQTVALMVRRRPAVVIVQSPPSLAVLVVWLCSVMTGTRFAVDAHSDAMLSPVWTRPRWLHRFLARRAAATIVTNDHFAARLRREGADALVIPDVPATFEVGDLPSLGEGPHVMVVTSFAPDEPLAAILDAARGLEDVRFHVTGDVRRADAALVATAPDNVRWTGFLPDDRYYALMRASDVVLCLTTRDHTMQRGACEALSLARPIVTSDWSVLREYFDRGARHVDNSPAAIRDAILEIARDHDGFERDIEQLRTIRRDECDLALEHLVARLTPGRAAGKGGMRT